MRVLTPTGPVVLRNRSYPLAGVDYPRQYQQGNRVLTLGTDVNETARTQSYIQIFKANPWVNAAVRTGPGTRLYLPDKTYI